MLFIRSLLLFIYLIVFTAPNATACFIAFPFMNADRRYRMAVGWCHTTLFVARWLNVAVMAVPWGPLLATGC